MMKLEGFDELEKRLGDLKRRAEEIDGEHRVNLAELLTEDFLTENTSFASLDEMFEASGFKVESAGDFARIPDEEWDEFIAAHTKYASWREMLGAAAQRWTARKLGF